MHKNRHFPCVLPHIEQTSLVCCPQDRSCGLCIILWGHPLYIAKRADNLCTCGLHATLCEPLLCVVCHIEQTSAVCCVSDSADLSCGLLPSSHFCTNCFVDQILGRCSCAGCESTATRARNDVLQPWVAWSESFRARAMVKVARLYSSFCACKTRNSVFLRH